MIKQSCDIEKCSDFLEDEYDSKIWPGVGEIKFRPFIQQGVEKEPLSTNAPDSSDDTKNSKLISELVRQGGFELRERNDLRERILVELKDLITKWAVEFIRRRKQEAVSTDAACQIVPFGSFCLGVHTEESDIDVLCVVPKCVNRSDFFSEIPQVLACCDKVDKTTLLTIQDAFVPVIRFQYCNIDIDLSVARLACETLPEKFNVADDEHLIELTDPKDITCLNGPRVTIEILRRVPNVKHFRTLLRSVKLWARRKGIYSNMVGFPGGVAWAIMAAHVCQVGGQLYPNMNAWMLLEKFFFLYKAWSFANPIQIAPLEDCRLPGAHAHVAEWDPLRLHPVNRRPMSVITPTFPAANATYNASKSTVAVIKQEVQMSFASVMEKGSDGISALFESVRFFRLYKNFLEVQITAVTSVIKPYCAYVNSQLRKFIERLHGFSEQVGPGGGFLELAHPCTDCFRNSQCILNIGMPTSLRLEGLAEGQERALFFIGLKFSEEVVKRMRDEHQQVNLTNPTQDFLSTLDHSDGAEIKIQVVKKKDIPDWVKELSGDLDPSKSKPTTPSATAAATSRAAPAALVEKKARRGEEAAPPTGAGAAPPKRPCIGIARSSPQSPPAGADSVLRFPTGLAAGVPGRIQGSSSSVATVQKRRRDDTDEARSAQDASTALRASSAT